MAEKRSLHEPEKQSKKMKCSTKEDRRRTFDDRQKRNELRKNNLVALCNATETENLFRPAKKVTLRFCNDEPVYEVFYDSGTPAVEVLKLNDALHRLPLPVLCFLGAYDDAEVSNEEAILYGLMDDGDELSCKEWGIKNQNGKCRDWIPRKVKLSRSNELLMLDPQTDQSSEWHEDGCPWSLSAMRPELLFEALDLRCAIGKELQGAIKELYNAKKWLINLFERCKEKDGKAVDVGGSIGCRDDNTKNKHVLKLEDGIRQHMLFYSPGKNCLLAACRMLIYSAGDKSAVERLDGCRAGFKKIGAIQTVLQTEAKTGWTCNRVRGAYCGKVEDNLNLILSKKIHKGIFLALLQPLNGSRTHAVGIDTEMDIVWDANEKYALPLNFETLQYCCGPSMVLEGIYEIRELIKQ